MPAFEAKNFSEFHNLLELRWRNMMSYSYQILIVWWLVHHILIYISYSNFSFHLWLLFFLCFIYLEVPRKSRIVVMLCAIWFHLFNLKNVKNNHGGAILLVISLKVSLLHGHFSRFLNCANVTKLRKVSHINTEIWVLVWSGENTPSQNLLVLSQQ